MNDLREDRVLAGQQATMEANPFDRITYGNSGKKLSSIVKAYNPGGAASQDAYAWIQKHLASAVAETIRIRAKY